MLWESTVVFAYVCSMFYLLVVLSLRGLNLSVQICGEVSYKGVLSHPSAHITTGSSGNEHNDLLPPQLY